jgi:hypothetical protein
VEPTAAFAQLQLGFVDHIQWRMEHFAGLVDKSRAPKAPVRRIWLPLMVQGFGHAILLAANSCCSSSWFRPDKVGVIPHRCNGCCGEKAIPLRGRPDDKN